MKVINPYLLTTESTGFCVLNYIFKIKVNSNNKKELLIEYGTNENLTSVEFNSEKKTEFYKLCRFASCEKYPPLAISSSYFPCSTTSP